MHIVGRGLVTEGNPFRGSRRHRKINAAPESGAAICLICDLFRKYNKACRHPHGCEHVGNRHF